MLESGLNERLTRVSRGTPMGDLLARYWHPISTTGELHDDPVKAVRLLGMDLTLFMDRRGALGLIAQRCAHRRVDLKWGIPRENGLRCPYHGWTYDASGQCVDMPAEPEGSQFADKVKIASYPVEELGGLIWAYVGPQPAPLVPRWRPLVLEGAFRHVATTLIPCNWLQCMENSVDPAHAEYLHGYLWEYFVERHGYMLRGTPEQVERGLRHHIRTDFATFEHGIIKYRLFEGQSEDAPDWVEGHPLIFPNAVSLGAPGLYQMEFRVPVDDLNTWALIYQAYLPGHGVEVPEQEYLPTYEAPMADLGYIGGQDMTIWASQEAIMDRSQERLGAVDVGVIMYRRMLEEQAKVVEDGGEPMNVFRDPERNNGLSMASEEYGPVGVYRRGSAYLRTGGPFSPVLPEIDDLLAKGSEAAGNG